ncbi:MAG TPA: aldo/keto reductase [Gaiellaceae bacterium]|nr:aldo/keto reductase [Gaiellaceae bacterium]
MQRLHWHILASIDASLQRLGLDYVDLYQIHRWDPHTPIEETSSPKSCERQSDGQLPTLVRRPVFADLARKWRMRLAVVRGWASMER